MRRPVRAGGERGFLAAPATHGGAVRRHIVATTGYFVPAADLLPYWPHDLLAPSDVPGLGSIARRIGVSDFDTVEYDGNLVAFGTLAISGEIELGIPLLKACRSCSARAAAASPGSPL
jgi:hypothetical protein